MKTMGPQKQRKARHQRQRPKIRQNAVTSVSSSWLSKTTVLMMNKCTGAYNIANEFLKLSTAICMSTRPWSDINPDDAHTSDLLMSCAQAATAGEPLQKIVQIRLLWPITLCLVVAEQFRSLLEHPLQGDLQRPDKNRVMNIHGSGTKPSQLWKNVHQASKPGEAP